MKRVKIVNKFIGEGEPCFIVAEAGINHNGDLKIAKKLVDAAKDAGADAIKFQTYTTENFLSKNVITPKHVKESIFDLLKRLELSVGEYKKLAEYSKRKGIIFMSTPLDYGSVDLLHGLCVPVFKVASCDLNNLPLIKYIAKKHKPMIVSTGLGNMGEIEEAVAAARAQGNNDIILLHCVSVYPPKPEEVNLKAIDTIHKAFQVPTGYSDHTLGIHISLAAVARGAKVIEKHFTLDRKMEGPDQELSADPAEFTRLVLGIREIEKSIGTGIKLPSKDETSMKPAFRRSIVANLDIPAGTIVRERMLAFKRPGTGLEPKYADFITGKKAVRDIKADDFLKFEDVA